MVIACAYVSLILGTLCTCLGATITNASSASAGFSMHLNQGTMEPLAVDGYGLVDDSTSAAGGFGVLYPGERLDVVLDKTTTTSRASKDETSTNTLTIELDDG